MNNSLLTEKRCTQCGEIKPITEFYGQKHKNFYRYHSECKECTNKIKRVGRNKYSQRNTYEYIAELDKKKPLKRCRTCKEVKPISEFHIDRAHSDGHHGQCKPCHRKWLNQQYRKRHDRLNHDELILYRTSINKKAKERKDFYKLTTLTHYSVEDYPICANPFGVHTEPMTDTDILTIDHINGGGNRHTDDGGRRIGGANLYRILCNSDFPEGYQVLCANCQMKKAIVNKEHPMKYDHSIV